MTTYQTPCQQGDPENWFIEDDGKQYPDDELVTDAQVAAHLDRAAAYAGQATEDLEPEDPMAVRAHLEAVAKADAMKRRRHAIDACHVDCLLRVQCLTLGLEPGNLSYGVYGGYTAKQRREIVRLRDEREARRG